MRIKTFSSLALVTLIAGCGGGGSSSHNGSGGGSGSGTTLASSFTITATEDYNGAGFDSDGHIVAVVAQTGSGGVVSSLGYYPASAGKTPTFPTGYTVNYVFGVSGHFALFDVNDSTGTEGALILNVSTNQSAFESGREIQAADGDRILTAATGDDGSTDFKIETFNSGSASVSSTKSVTLPTGVDVSELAGDYLLVNNVQARAHVRAVHPARLAARDTGDFSLYTTSGTKVLDYAAPTGATLGYVYSINASGQAVGTVTETVSGTAESFGVSWDKSGTASFLPGGGLNVRPGSISDGGTIVATYQPSASDPSQNVAYSYSGGKQTTLSALGNGFTFAGISRSGKGIATYSYNDATNSSTTTAYVVK